MKLAVAITGASGSIYAKLLLRELRRLLERGAVQEVSVVWSSTAKQVWEAELDEAPQDGPPFRLFEKTDFNAPFASGSAGYDAMIICPCSTGTLGRIAAGVSGDLVIRGADVMLKERRKLVLLVRETPYNLIHIRAMKTITEAGGIICPASPSFYSRPQTLEDAAKTVVHRALQLCGIDPGGYKWGSPPTP
jgi:4-hydroxy-3-polyprenylbenzoate decarboxylase